MSKPSFSSDLNLVYTAHGQEFLATRPKDQYYTESPALAALRSRSQTKDGGANWFVPVLSGGDAVGGFYTKSENLSVTPVDPVTDAVFTPKFAAEPVIVWYQDEKKAGGMGAKLNLVETLTMAARKRLERKLESALWAASPDTTKEILSIPTIIPTNPATGTIGGINRATYSWWRSKSDTTGGVFSSVGLDQMRTMANNVSRGGGGAKFDIVFTTQTMYEEYVALAEADVSFQYNAGDATAKRIAELGFPMANYMGRPITWSENCPSGTVYFLNYDALQLVEMNGGAFKLSEFESTWSQGQFSRVAWLTWEGELVPNECRVLGQVSGLTAS